MAAMPTCDGPDDDPAAFMITNISEAETVALCVPCMADYCQAVLQIVAPDSLAQPPAAAPAKRKSRTAAAAAAAADGQEGAAHATAGETRQAAGIG